MATRKPNTAVAEKPAEPEVTDIPGAKEEVTALAKQGTRVLSAALQVTEGVDAKDKRGTEGIDNGDLILPRLALCQSNSPQRKRGNEKFIPGLEEGMMFNSLTGEIYEAPLQFIPISLRKHAIEFKPMEEGGGIVDRNVPFNDPRCEYDNTKTGKDAKPKATRFYDWLGYLPATGELIVASFKGTSEKAGKKIATLSSTVRPGPTFSHLYELTTAFKQENNYDWHLFVATPAGPAEVGDALIGEANYVRFAGKSVRYDEESQAEVEGKPVDGAATRTVDGTVADEL